MFALHECDIPLYVKVNRPECLRQHVVAGTSKRTCGGWRGRGAAVGGRPFEVGGEARRARSVALRDAVRDGDWDAAAVYSAFLGSERDCSERRKLLRDAQGRKPLILHWFLGGVRATRTVGDAQQHARSCAHRCRRALLHSRISAI